VLLYFWDKGGGRGGGGKGFIYGKKR